MLQETAICTRKPGSRILRFVETCFFFKGIAQGLKMHWKDGKLNIKHSAISDGRWVNDEGWIRSWDPRTHYHETKIKDLEIEEISCWSHSASHSTSPPHRISRAHKRFWCVSRPLKTGGIIWCCVQSCNKIDRLVRKILLRKKSNWRNLHSSSNRLSSHHLSEALNSLKIHRSSLHDVGMMKIHKTNPDWDWRAVCQSHKTRDRLAALRQGTQRWWMKGLPFLKDR